MLHQPPSRANSSVSPRAGPNPLSISTPLGAAKLGQTDFAPSHAMVSPESFPCAVELLEHCGDQHLPLCPPRGQIQVLALGHSPRQLPHLPQPLALTPSFPGSPGPAERHLSPYSPPKSWQGDAGIMLGSLCSVTAVLKAPYLSHYTGRLE